jgi:hypothetical protein
VLYHLVSAVTTNRKYTHHLGLCSTGLEHGLKEYIVVVGDLSQSVS